MCNKGLPYLQTLQRLRRLSLQGTGLTSTGMPVIGSLTALQDLDLAWTSVDSQGDDRCDFAYHIVPEWLCICSNVC